MNYIIQNVVGNNKFIEENYTKTLTLNETQQGLLYDILSKKVKTQSEVFYDVETQQEVLYDKLLFDNLFNTYNYKGYGLYKLFIKDDLFLNVKTLCAITNDEKAVKNFILSIEQKSKFFRNYIKEFKNFTHSSWKSFKGLVNLNINKIDCDNMYIAVCVIEVMIKSSFFDERFDESFKIIKNILKNKFELFQDLWKNDPLFYLVCKSWGE